ncbi:hypothetical protein GDO81_027535 [Engystomops pustulosus]|uniref:Uncharacterized protein n=1 Tax=Engystomops pustulosus TaxID=76066 RepID=A0AAV6YM85_ENGPU|nr:hypothetical protein GDO81_027535 [Engystomops pustulosus]
MDIKHGDRRNQMTCSMRGVLCRLWGALVQYMSGGTGGFHVPYRVVSCVLWEGGLWYFSVTKHGTCPGPGCTQNYPQLQANPKSWVPHNQPQNTGGAPHIPHY